MTSDAEGRLAAVLQRELGALEVRFVRSPAPPAEDSEAVLTSLVPGGPLVVAHFHEPQADREAKARRMEMIVASFADLLSDASPDATRHKHPQPARSLAGELSALAGRAGALAGLVVDAKSPVIWGASDAPDASDDAAEETDSARLNHMAARAGLRFSALVSEPLLDTTEGPHQTAGDASDGVDAEAMTPEERAEFWRRVLLVRNALAAVRALPHVANLHKGEHLHESVRTPELSYVVRSFATIYMLLLVFDRPFDELRAERSVAHALPTIERLVLALPPSEPTPPMAGVGVMRSRRR
jgi:hypothetical protein